MAKLERNPYPGDWEWKPGMDFDEHHTRTTAMLEAIETTISFQRGDGHAIYAVKSISPPVLQFVPYGDAYQISAAEIRGLRSVDIQEILDRQKRLRELFQPIDKNPNWKGGKSGK